MPKSNEKGTEFERKLCKRLSQWWVPGRDDVFWRTAGSGARSTSRAKQGKATHASAGDITYLDKVGKPLIDKFLIEIKRGYSKELDLLSLVDYCGKQPTIYKWLEKADEERATHNRRYLLFFIRRDRKQPVALICYRACQEITDYAGPLSNTTCCFIEIPWYCNDPNKYFIIMGLEDFLQWATPSTIKLVGPVTE